MNRSTPKDKNADSLQRPTMTGAQFAALGADQLAYVKAVTIDDVDGYAVHGADGKPLAVYADRDVAMAAARQANLEPLSVH